MDYFLVSLAVIGNSAAFALTKAYQKRFVKGVGSLLFFQISPAAIGSVFFLCLIGFRLEFGTFTFFMALAYVLAGTTYAILGLIIIRLGKLSVYMIFLMLGGMLIPFVYGIAFLGEIPTAAQIAGIIVLTASLFVPFIRFKRKGEEETENEEGNAPKSNIKLFIVLCVCVFILNGCVSVISKVHQINEAALNTNQFLTWINFFNLFLSASVFGIFQAFARARSKRAGITDAADSVAVTPERNARRKEFLFALLLLTAIALISCLVGILMMVSAKNLPATVMFPMVTGGIIVLTSLAGRLFYKEKINLPLGIGLVLTLAGTLLFLF